MRQIYIVDDDRIYHYTTKVLINRLFPEIDIAHFYDGKPCITELKQHADQDQPGPDIIFLDINMPDLNGWQFLEQFQTFKHKFSAPPVIYIVSSSIDPGDMNKAKTFPEVTGYLTKPLNVEMITDIFNKRLSL